MCLLKHGDNDEYDAPLIDQIDNIEEAKKIQKVMKAFYGVIKAMDRYIRFVLITGVSKFTRVSIFSELNHLTELTMLTMFGTALGLTEQELRDNLAEHITEFATQSDMTDEELLAKIRFWYNGFCFASNAENVYNPFSTMQLFHNRQFKDYWFKSGTPTFLIKLIQAGGLDIEELDELRQSEESFDSFDIERLSLIALLFQTGYLTIKGYDEESMEYLLDFPNHEVRKAFLSHLLDMFSYLTPGYSKSTIWKMIRAIRKDDLHTFFGTLQSFFADIDYNLHLNNEKYYHSIFFAAFKLMGLDINAEVTSNVGRIDAVITLDDHIYIFEFKFNKTAQDALNQIHTKQYYQRYLSHGKPITLIGANFSQSAKGVEDWVSERFK
ncbi:MAG: AAA family ATPase [Chloroflexota bacterium]